ncbi:MAG TPA: dUTP diphosphatase [Magnetospirillaceae bacterium]|jgi:dUTP pyrophosphatase
MNIELKLTDPRLEQWGLPTFATAGSAAVDLMACAIYGKTADNKPDFAARRSMEAPAQIEAGQVLYVGVGFAMDIGKAEVGAFILPRSGMGSALGLVMGNGTGLIDSDYQREVIVACLNRNAAGQAAITIKPGDRIAQMYFAPVLRPNWSVVTDFSRSTERGLGGFGSTGSGSKAAK